MSRSNVSAVDTSLTERQSKKLGFQSITENWQCWRSPNLLRQTVPDRCGSRRERTVANGSTSGAWSDQRPKCICSEGSAPKASVGAYSDPPHSLAGGEGASCPSSSTPPPHFGLKFQPFGLRSAIGGSVIAADCGVQSPFVWAMGCRYLCCAT